MTSKFPLKFYIQEVSNQIKLAKSILLTSLNVDQKAHYFLIHCTIIVKLIMPFVDQDSINTKKKGWKNELYKLNRQQAMLDYFHDKIFDFPQIKAIRNSFEHYDQRLDIAVQKNGFVVQGNLSIGKKFDECIVGIDKGSILRNYEEGQVVINGDRFNMPKIIAWLDLIEKHISHNPIKESNIGQITNCRFH
ncbi:MAG: hypothetical protein WC107_02040 [Patescibacteria group bacterium]